MTNFDCLLMAMSLLGIIAEVGLMIKEYFEKQVALSPNCTTDSFT